MIDVIKTLYHKDSKDKTRVWQIGIEDKGIQSEIVIRSGLLDGKQTTQTIVVSSGKNIGKSNETTHFQQAEKEVDSRIDAQIRSGYVSKLEDLKDNAVLGSGILKPMLAQKYDPTRKQKGSKDLSQLGLRGKEVAVQPKLDGNRCIVIVGSFGATAYTREGDFMPVQPEWILTPIYQRYLSHVWAGGSPDLILDGELYSHGDISFSDLNGLLKKISASQEQKLKREKYIKYYLYDVMLSSGFEVREEFIRGNFHDTENVELVRTDFVPAEEKELVSWLEGYVKQGYEGLIVRQLGIPYENKRTWQLLKYKQFEDEEFELVGFEEDKRSGFVGAFIMRLPEPVVDRNNKIHTTFKAGASGQNESLRKKMWENQSEYLGRIATIKFFGRSEYGIPRFPKMKGFVK